MLNHLKLDFQSQAHPDAVIQSGPVRFTVLTYQLIRMEYDPTQQFEDRPSQVFWHRNLPVPKFSQSSNDTHVSIETDHLSLHYRIQDSGFYHRFLEIYLKDEDFTWKYGQENNTNLLGTVRTLDRIDGATPLNPGLLSRSGWALIDDSQSLVFNHQGWLERRTSPPEYQDLYFFGYGKDFTECIIDFQTISGRVPILPRFALGNWWSRYWEYHQDELIDLMHDFHHHKVPLSVCVVDMDWHITDTGNESSGWTGYTWNPDLFPDPVKFLSELKDLGLKTALNLHPALGVHPHESQYEAMAERLNIDPNTKQPIPFDIASPEFTKAYFEILHHPLEDMGVDFWWLDWQQGTQTKVEGLDPLFWLNHLHFYDLARNSKKRPFIFSRWGGLGSQRYPIGFSGDTFMTWKTLQFQPYFTATAANVGYGWWSHDIGGHMGGVDDPELYLRWIQYGVFSPIFRLHSTKNLYLERLPWGYDAQTEILASEAMRLRHRLIPYLYTAAWRNYQDGILPIRPMYHLFPIDNHAYQCPKQYTFGSELIAIPFTTPIEEHTRMSRQVVWLPEGDWFDFFTGEYYSGGGWYAIYGGLERMPVFAKAGGMIPLGPDSGWSGIGNPDTMVVNIFPGANNLYQLYEDDGESQAYQDGEYAITTFTLTQHEDHLIFGIKPVDCKASLLPAKRIFKLVFFAIHEPDSVRLMLDSEEIHPSWHYNPITHQLIITDIVLPVTSQLKVRIANSEDLVYRENPLSDTIKKMLKVFKLNTFIKQSIHENLDALIKDPFILKNYADSMKESHILALIESWMGKQTDRISDHPEEALQRIIGQLYQSN
jgi:alpha-glucosidase (family GH31 glycosyl hydrolase)